MAGAVLTIVALLIVPVAILWRVAYEKLLHDPTDVTKLFFWILSVLFIALAAAAFIATRFIE